MSEPVLVPPDVAGPAASRRGRADAVWLAALLAVQLLPFALLPRIPTQDGPSHQALAYALRIWELPAAAPLHHYLERNPEALPNWFTFFLQVKALSFLSLPLADKVLMAAYTIMLPLSVRYCLLAIDRESGFLAILALPMTYNFPFAMGFLNFCWSLAAMLFALGWWLRRRRRCGPVQAGVLALLVLWVYFCHPISLVMLLVAMTTLGACWAIQDAHGGDDGARRRSLPAALRERLLWPLIAFVPSLLLLGAFVGRRLDRPAPRLPLLVKAKQLLALYSLVSFDRRTLLPALALALLLAALAGLLLSRQCRSRSPSEWNALLVVAGAFALIALLAPSQLAGGGFVDQRVQLYAPLALLLWLGCGRWTGWARWATQLAAAVIAFALVGLLSYRWWWIDAALLEYDQAAAGIEDARTVLPLALAPAGRGPSEAFRVWPFVHAVGYTAAQRPIVDLGLYEAGEDYFPLRFRPQLDPYRRLQVERQGIEEVPPRVDVAAYERAGGEVDYVLLWEPGAAPTGDPWTRRLYAQLRARYELARRSPGGRAELWRRRAGLR